jgi:hypothetical protein
MEIQKNMAVCFGVCEKRDRKSGWVSVWDMKSNNVQEYLAAFCRRQQIWLTAIRTTVWIS